MHGGQQAVALPRGEGKTTIIIGAILWAILYGWRRYVVAVAADQGAAERLLDGIRAALDSSEVVNKLFPEAAHYARALENLPQRAAGQLANETPTGITWRANCLILAQVAAGPDEYAPGAVIEARGLTGRIRGLQQTLQDGTVVRPDMYFIDDPQTRESAKSPEQCRDRLEIIRADIMGGAGIGRDVAAIMACTVICEGDLVDQVLNEWRSIRAAALYVEPKAANTLWREYVDMRRRARRDGTERKICNAFYRRHRRKMDAGAKVGNPHRRNEGDLSALQTIYNYLADNGEASYRSELQNDPRGQESALYQITVKTVESRFNGLERCDAPEDCHFIIAGVDVNFYALNWVVVAVRGDFATFVVDYGRYPAHGEPLWQPGAKGTAEAAIYMGVVDLADQLRLRHPRLGLFAVDGNYATDTICRAVDHLDRTLPLRVMVMRGVPSDRYSLPADGKKKIQDGQECFYGVGVRGPHVVFNSHYWHKRAQEGFLLTPGAPGAISLWGDSNADHSTFAAHVCADRLLAVETNKGKETHKWSRKPNDRNDLGDALVMAMAPASLFGAQATDIPQRIAAPADAPAAPATPKPPARRRQRVRTIEI